MWVEKHDDCRVISLLTKLSSSSTRWKSGQQTFQVLREENVVYSHTLLYVNMQRRHLVERYLSVVVHGFPVFRNYPDTISLKTKFKPGWKIRPLGWKAGTRVFHPYGAVLGVNSASLMIAVIIQAVSKPMLSSRALIDFMILSAGALCIIPNALHTHAFLML